MKMKRMRRTSSALMEAMELTRLFTKLPILAQYLVTLKALRRRIHLRTERPTGGMISWLTRMNSEMELITTTKSNLLKSETMYPDRPRAYIFNNISQVNRQTSVTISQNIHCDLQMLRHCRFMDRFHFSNRFIRFCHGVCLICFRDIFRPSSETLAVTVTSTTCCRGSMADFSSPATMLFCLAELRSTLMAFC